MANDIPENASKTKLSFKPVYLIIAIVVLILSFGGAFIAGKTLLGSSTDPQEISSDENSHNKIGPLYNSPEFTVNLADTNGRRFLMTQFSLEVDDKKVLKEVEAKLPVIQDKVIIILSSQTIDNLNSSNGKEKIKQLLKDNLNEILSDGQIVNIYFNKFVWQ